MALSAAERRFVARKAGKASGRKRRQLADPQRRRICQRELALKFRVRVIDRAEFDRRDFDRRLRFGLEPNERGTETLWQEYCSCVRAFHAQGQGFLTTNGQRAQALRKRGRPRCERTIQRAHAALADMGLLRRFHDRRGGARPGNKDRLRVQIAPSFVTPPSAAGAAGLRPSAAPARNGLDCNGFAVREGRPASPTRLAPPAAAGAGCAGEERQHRRSGGASPTEAIDYLAAQLALPFDERSGPTRNTVTLEAKLAFARFEAAQP